MDGLLELFHALPPLGDLGEGLVAGAPVPDEPTSDYGPRAPYTRPTVDVYGLTGSEGGVDGVQDGSHVPGAVGGVQVDYRVALMADGYAKGPGLFLGDRVVGFEFMGLGQVDEVVDARFEEAPESFCGAGRVHVARVLARGEGAGDYPVGVGGGGIHV